jgi:hypothetical protein
MYGRYRLLLFDGYSSHLTFQFLEYCNKKKIIPFCFSPYTTHLLQPLDGKPFQQYKHWFYKKNNKIAMWGGVTANKRDFLCGIKAVRDQALKPKTIRHAFAERGIYPIKASLILEPLEKRRFPIPELEFHTGQTPPPALSSIIVGSSPLDTIYRLRKNILKVEKSIREIKEIINAKNPQL